MSSSAEKNIANVGVIGLGVMGRNIALNLTDHGYHVAGFDLSPQSIDALKQMFEDEINGERPGGIVGCESTEHFLAALKSPRVVIVLVPAGKAVDAVCESLLEAGIDPADIVVDCGNSQWSDTIRREKEYRGKLTFFGSGVSGGAVGARFGPSLMPGGDGDAWKHLRPMWQAIAAKVDPRSGKPLEGARPGKPVTDGEPCTTYIGTDGAGHYVKMVHNGIEYADMQLICEAYDLMRCGQAMSPAEIGTVFAEWNDGELDSYLIEITADILKMNDPQTTRPMVEMILDRAGQKGTGTWTAVSALQLGVPAPTIAEAVFARGLSAAKQQRVQASKILHGPDPTQTSLLSSNKDTFLETLRDALYCAKVCAYAQGFALMSGAANEHGWQLDFKAIASIWRGGCIIRASLLQEIMQAYAKQPEIDNLLTAEYFKDELDSRQTNWRNVIAYAAQAGIPCPAMTSALAYYDAYRRETLPANLLQAQRDYFGSHGFERVDQASGEHFHLPQR